MKKIIVFIIIVIGLALICYFIKSENKSVLRIHKIYVSWNYFEHCTLDSLIFEHLDSNKISKSISNFKLILNNNKVLKFEDFKIRKHGKNISITPLEIEDFMFKYYGKPYYFDLKQRSSSKEFKIKIKKTINENLKVQIYYDKSEQNYHTFEKVDTSKIVISWKQSRF